MPQTYAATYLLKAAASAPRDMVNGWIARFKPIHPTVLIFHCTFVCDARCEMCSNWQRGDRKSDMTLDQIDRVFASPLWRDVEMANLSGGEPTTRNDMVEISRVFIDRFPKLRKIGINTTGLTPHRAIPLLTETAELCASRNVMFSARVSIDGIGDMHNDVRQVKRGFDKALETIRAMQALQKRLPLNFGISTTLFAKNIGDAENVLAWAKTEHLDIVFNMVRFTEPMLGNAALSDTVKPIGPDEARIRRFLLDRVVEDPLLDGQSYIHMHYADMIGNG
jgi:MoaA/NifB/PqqE/SkfB family radical SAM enzyme